VSLRRSVKVISELQLLHVRESESGRIDPKSSNLVLLMSIAPIMYSCSYLCCQSPTFQCAASFGNTRRFIYESYYTHQKAVSLVAPVSTNYHMVEISECNSYNDWLFSTTI